MRFSVIVQMPERIKTLNNLKQSGKQFNIQCHQLHTFIKKFKTNTTLIYWNNDRSKLRLDVECESESKLEQQIPSQLNVEILPCIDANYDLQLIIPVLSFSNEVYYK